MGRFISDDDEQRRDVERERWDAKQGSRDGRTLPWMLMKRTIRPYALAVSVASFVVFWSMITESGVGRTLEGPWGKAIGVAALVSTLFLWFGWWGQWRFAMDQGLLLATAVWGAVAAITLMEGGAWVSGWLAFAWMIASGGAWLLEVNDPPGAGRASER